MSLAMYFSPESFNAAQYDEVNEGLDAAGQRTPAGRSIHVVFGEGDNLQVFDVWESMEAFEAFGATLMPLLESANINVGQPMISPVHNVITA
jgi:hypothetical protein